MFISLDKTNLPKSSSFGILVSFRGVTLDFADTSLTEISPDLWIV